MDLSAIFTDDQLGILGCFGALLACGLVAAVSFHFGPAGKTSQTPLKQPSLNIASRKVQSDNSHRKAA